MSLIKEKRTVNKIIAIQGSYRDNGITTMMLKYAVESVLIVHRNCDLRKYRLE